MRKYVLILALAMPLTAAAQFFDHFEGNELASHWNVWSEGTQWEYDVSDSVLNVNRLFGGPGQLQQMYMDASFDPLADFEMTAFVGWDEAEFQTLIVNVFQNADHHNPSWIGGLVYETKPAWETPLVTAAFKGGGRDSVAAPRTGMHEFRMTRTGDTMSAYFNGELVHEASGVVTYEARWVSFEFVSDDELQFAPLRVDMVQVVPEPATMTGLGAALLWLVARRRCRHGR